MQNHRNLLQIHKMGNKKLTHFDRDERYQNCCKKKKNKYILIEHINLHLKSKKIFFYEFNFLNF